MIKRPRGRPRADLNNTDVIRVSAAEILSQDNLPVKNLTGSKFSAIVRSVEHSNMEASRVTSALEVKKKGIMVQSETRQQCRYTSQDPEALAPIKIEEQQTPSRSATPTSDNEIDETTTSNSNHPNKKQKHVHFQLPEEEEAIQEDSTLDTGDKISGQTLGDVENVELTVEKESALMEDQDLNEGESNSNTTTGSSEEVTEDRQQLDKSEGSLYCSVCLSPQTVENFLNHIKQTHNQKNAAVAWGEFSLPVLLPLSYAVQSDADTHIPKRKSNSIIKHPDVIPNPDDPSFFCKACERTYGDKSSYSVHIVRVHNMQRPSTMLLVNPTTFPNPDDPDFYCVTCNRHFANISSFRTHIKVHYTGIQTTFNCEICAFPYGESGLLDQHMLDKHKIKRKEYADSPHRNKPNISNEYDLACAKCKSPNFYTIRDYLKHIDLHLLDHPEAVKLPVYAIPNPANQDLFCSACQKFYFRRDAFLKHLSDIHMINSPGFNGRIRYPSLKEGRTTRRASNAPTVRRARKGSPLRKKKMTDLFQANVDDSRGTATRSQPKRIVHRRVVHPEVMPDVRDEFFYCRSCEVKHPSQDEFYIHLQTQHKYATRYLPSEDGSTYFCSLCHAESADRLQFSAHLQEDHHMKLAEPATLSDFTCEVCQEEFPGKLFLSEHVEDEHPHVDPKKIKDFICCFCSVNCYHAVGLGLHKQKYHDISFVYDDVNLYCNLCDRVSASSIKYKQHLKLHKIDLDAKQPEAKAVKEKRAEVSRQAEGNKKDEEVKKKKTVAIKAQRRVPVTLYSRSRYDKPDVSDPENKFCRVCGVLYSSTIQYRLHCIKYHKVDM